jgi:hypothetical protein
MSTRYLKPLIVILLAAAPAAQAQPAGGVSPQLDGYWELVTVDRQPLPLAPLRESGDPSECGEYGEYVGQRIGEGRLVIRTAEMWMVPRSGRWEGGIYAYVADEILCRAAGGDVVVLRRDQFNRARLRNEVDPVWRAGSIGAEETTG